MKISLNKNLFEATILFILLLNLFRQFKITNVYILGAVGILIICFIVVSMTIFSKNTYVLKSREVILALCVVVTYSYLFGKSIYLRINDPISQVIHDGLIQTEAATSSLLSGKNPYSISFENVLKGDRFYIGERSHPVLTHYAYSPLTFLTNLPIQFLVRDLFKFVDARITLFLIFFATAWIGMKMVEEKYIFMILFLFNPLFVHSILIGAVDGIGLYFLFLCLFFLYSKKVHLATIFLAISFAAKLTVFPFLPLYFLYLYAFFNKNTNMNLFKQIIIFMMTSLIIYLPFFIWDRQAFIDDLVLFHLKGGINSFPIGGSLGIPQLLVSKGLISPWSSFPFYLILPFIFTPFLFFSFKIFRNSLFLGNLIILYVLLFVITFSLMSVFNPNYLDYISQVLVLGSLINKRRR